ncbi:hypothetical protein K490DRAFT_70889 [Saccharata proteae CBS 121410]|uniref:Uncharacterized protein n=1 Tax=Saccharata proteae CBS 121410 TaxID=1314787 RepID=A0A9P4M2G3_9PEZI|nr:hypothetical protein K490DRAFT_70889 [Saccharata proteae CBS 121410]
MESTPSTGIDAMTSQPSLSPSPKIVSKRQSKDDNTLPNPRTPRRPDFLSRGLSLQMPPRDPAIGLQTPANITSRVPLSPQLDTRDTYGSPATVLPRHSRGLDFARACTNLHHSTLAEQSSPDSSPTITQKGMMIPQRKSNFTSMSLDSPHHMHSNDARWPTTTNNREKSVASSSVGSINMMESDSASSGSDEDDPMDPDNDDDPMVMTPQVLKLERAGGLGFTGHTAPSPGAVWSGGFSPGGPNFLQIQRNRLRKVRSRKSSSSASGHSSLASPGPGSPPPNKGFDGANGGYFAQQVMRKAGSRRESLTLGTNDLHISSGNDSGDEAGMPIPSTPGVIRRPVVRRGNLLPKSRQFGRIRAELLEESAPVDSEVKREAEIIRQVRESDAVDPAERHQSTTANSSPTLMPAVPGLNELEDIPEDSGMGLEEQETAAASHGKGLFGAFSLQSWRNTSERTSWSNGDGQMQTPPPPFFPRGSSSAVSDDINMDSPATSIATGFSARASLSHEQSQDHNMSRSSTPQPMVPPTAADGLKKKRRRDDDFDINSFKRRAVSPGLSVHNSPILSQSPQQRDNTIWIGPPKSSREGSASGHAAGERSNSGGSTMSVTPSLGPKRVGLQGMTDTNDGLMKMSIE